jgi:hypothetical protein
MAVAPPHGERTASWGTSAGTRRWLMTAPNYVRSKAVNWSKLRCILAAKK